MGGAPTQVDPGQERTSTRAEPLATSGQNRWPPAGTYMAATGHDLMAADILRTVENIARRIVDQTTRHVKQSDRGIP